MPAPATTDEFLELVRKSGVLDDKKLDAYLQKLRAAGGMPTEPAKAAGLLERDGLLTRFQAEQFMLGKWRRFNIGKYKVLERLGQGGMGSVYLCEHKLMRRRVAVKVLPTAKADDPSSLERFYREARAVAALDHPNIVRAYDIDQDENLHFLVMEYVDGASLQEIVKKSGPLDVARAAHYIRQSAQGLQHAHQAAGLVHRDIKPGNILVDRNGVVKVLDMGLARFFHDEEDILTKKYDENVLGTADYLAPEQALDSHAVDIRADIYSLGATFYYCLTGKTPFSEGTVAQKLIWHQTRQPKPIRTLRPEVPEGLAALVEKMMSKEAGQRFQTPQAVVDALAPWTRTSIGPPPEDEMPRLCAAALGVSTAEGGSLTQAPTTSMPISPAPRKAWQVSGAPASRPPASQPPTIKQTTPRGNPPPPPAQARAAPAPAARNNGRAVPVVTAKSSVEEESVAWERLTPDTHDRQARGDTAPSAPPSSRRRLPSETAFTESDRRRVIWVVAIVTGLMLLVALIVLIVALIWGSGGSPSSGKGGQPSAETQTIFVSRGGQDGTLRTVAGALAKARPGDTIQVLDGPVEEPLLPVLDGRRHMLKDVTLETAPGADVVWKLPPNAPPAHQILTLANMQGFTLRGFTFDGGGAVEDALVLTDDCAGLVLDQLRLKGFKRAGILMANCRGAAGRPVQVSGQVTVSKDTESALVFEIKPGFDVQVSQHIVVTDLSVVGPCKTPVLLIPGPAAIDNTVVLSPALRPKT